MKGKIILLAMAVGILALSSCRKRHDELPASPEIDVARAVADSVMLHDTYPGYLKADKAIDIVARVSGTLTSKRYKDGDVVRKGQVLFTIEPTQYADAVQQASAQLATAQSAYEYASSHYEAVKKALESDAVSQMEVRQARSSMEQAAAAIKTARAQLETARLNLGYCTITAPATGRITPSAVDVDAFVGGGATPFRLATVYDDSRLKAVFSIEDASHQRMLANIAQSGDTALTTVALSFQQPLAHGYTGRLDYIAPDVNTGTGTLQLYAVVANPWGELRDGMFVNITVPTAYDADAVMVKDASIGTDQLGRYLYVVNDSDRVVYTPVKVGEIVADTMRIITDGIKPGTMYVTKALLKVRDGMAVRPRVISGTH